VSAIRESVGISPVLITPGVRPADADVGDQSRIMTPVDAIKAGATFLVIGRPITTYFSTSAQAMTDRARQIVDSLH
jgi:orotidine-5'-phosphate decarboxylase